MKLSVIVPTHNRPQSLGRTLAALSAQTIDRDAFEVIVVDDGSTMENRTAGEAITAEHGFTCIAQQQAGLAAARNAGAERATGRVLYFLDDDVVPQQDALDELLQWHERTDKPVAVLGSLPFPEEILRNPFIWYLDHCCHYEPFRHPEKYPGSKPLPPMNGNSSIERETFFELGKYDEQFRQYGAEDNELGIRVMEAGIEALYNERVVGHHYHLKGFEDYCGDQEKAGESIIRLYRKYPVIKDHKNIDVMIAPFSELPLRKKIRRLIMRATLALPAVLWAPRCFIQLFGHCYGMRRLLAPAYLWVSHYHYAVGMQRGLKQT